MRESNLEAVAEAVRDLWDNRDDYKLAINGWVHIALVRERVDLSESRVCKALKILTERGELVRAKTLVTYEMVGGVCFGYAPAEAVATDDDQATDSEVVGDD
jgi:predicted transcriptional regulator